MKKHLVLLVCLVPLLAVGAGNPWPDAGPRCSMILAAADNPDELGANDDFVDFILPDNFATTNGNADRWVTPVDVVVSRLRMSVNAAPGGAANDDVWLAVVQDDGSDTAVQCTITGTETSCTDTTNRVLIAANSDIVVRIDSSTGTSDPTSATEMLISLCLAPE